MVNSETNLTIDEFRIRSEQLHAYFQQLPAISIAPALGSIFVCIVLWGAVQHVYLIIGICAILAVSIIRLYMYHLYHRRRLKIENHGKWVIFSITIAFISGCTWGSAAIFIFPPQHLDYLVFMLVFLSLVPVAPIAALAVHMPHFYAYYIPCVVPFVLTLALRDTRAEHLTAVLLVMMMGATIAFASKYNKMLTDAIRLRLIFSDQKDVLQETSRLKTRFMASASHDLRQPLHAIGLFIESLRKRNTDKGSAYLVQKIEESTMSLRQMLNTLLDISRLDAGAVEVKNRHFFLQDLLEKLESEYAPLAHHKGLKFRYVPTTVAVYSDPVLLERILRNLVSNAIKYTRMGGVVLGCRRKQKYLCIQIVDTGPGISENNVEKIFTEFTQLHHASYSPDKGLGLGLSIVERMAKLLRHDIVVKSKLGHGTVFSVCVGRSHEHHVTSLRVHHETEVNQAFAHDIHAVVIDDDRTILEAMQSLLREWGVSAIAGAHFKDVMPYIKKTISKVDLLIIDYHLENELKATDIISEMETVLGYKLKVIIITGDTSPELIHEAHTNSHILLHKPVEIEKLQSCIRYLVG